MERLPWVHVMARFVEDTIPVLLYADTISPAVLDASVLHLMVLTHVIKGAAGDFDNQTGYLHRAVMLWDDSLQGLPQ